jgi:hypothetical protein
MPHNRPRLLLALLLPLTGCVAPPPDWSIPSALYGRLPPGQPQGTTETADQVRFGQSLPQAPITMAAQQAWPTVPDTVPTMLDLLNQPRQAETPAGKARADRQRRGGYGLCLPNTTAGHALGLC